MTQVKPSTPIVELRQYTVKSGRRDELIDLFEREFVHALDAAGAFVLGAFHDLDDPDRFVWIRGFEDSRRRVEALTSFYDGPVWRLHRDAANATMLDSDNVLLLQSRGRRGSNPPDDPLDLSFPITVTVFYLGDVDPALFGDFFDTAVSPPTSGRAAGTLRTFTTADLPNGFPRLPVREHEPVFVSFDITPDASGSGALSAMTIPGWRDRAPLEALPALMRKPERIRLQPAFALRTG